MLESQTKKDYSLFDWRQDLIESNAVHIEYLSKLSSMAYFANIATQIRRDYPDIIEMALWVVNNDRSECIALVQGAVFSTTLSPSGEAKRFKEFFQYFITSFVVGKEADSSYLLPFHNKTVYLKKASEWEPSDGLTLLNEMVGDPTVPF